VLVAQCLLQLVGEGVEGSTKLPEFRLRVLRRPHLELAPSPAVGDSQQVIQRSLQQPFAGKMRHYRRERRRQEDAEDSALAGEVEWCESGFAAEPYPEIEPAGSSRRGDEADDAF